MNAQFGDPFTGHRGVGQGTGRASQRRARLVGQRITPGRVETEPYDQVFISGIFHEGKVSWSRYGLSMQCLDIPHNRRIAIRRELLSN